MTTSEGQFKVGDKSLYTKTWTPEGHVKAKIIFVHGFSDHINRYNEIFSKFTEHGIQVLGWDQRGWGRSVTKPSEKGLTGPTSRVLADIVAFVQDKLPSDTPVFIMGHSMGGGEVLTLAGDAEYKPLVNQIRGWILESPFVGFAAGEEPSSLKVFMGRLAAKLLPDQQLKHEVPPEYLSRDQAVVESVKHDPLCHNTGTLEGLASLLDRTARLSSGEVQLGPEVHSLMMAHGTRDKICSYDATMKFAEEQTAVKDRVTKSYEGAYHQLHSDLCKDEFAKDVVNWVLERSDAAKQESGKVEAKL